MTTRILNVLILAPVLATPVAVVSACAQEISHTESDMSGWFGGHNHEETTVYKYADGSTSVEHEKTTVSP